MRDFFIGNYTHFDKINRSLSVHLTSVISINIEYKCLACLKMCNTLKYAILSQFPYAKQCVPKRIIEIRIKTVKKFY